MSEALLAVHICTIENRVLMARQNTKARFTLKITGAKCFVTWEFRTQNTLGNQESSNISEVVFSEPHRVLRLHSLHFPTSSAKYGKIGGGVAMSQALTPFSVFQREYGKATSPVS